MAGPRIVDVTLRLVDRLSGPLNSVGSSLARSATQWQRAGRQIQKVGKSISNVGSSMTRSITVPVVAVGAACVKVAADFEAGMSKVKSIAGEVSSEQLADLEKTAKNMGLSWKKGVNDTGTAMNILTAKALEMGKKTKFSATEATEAFSYMAMAGWKTEQMLNGIEGIMYLAGATGEDLGQTSDIVTDALTAFGMQANETNRFVDVLAQTANNTNTNVAMMGETFQYVAPVAGALKFNVEDTAVAIGLMANSGIKASVAGTALRSWMTNMAKPAKSARIAMENLGISLTNSDGSMKSLNTVMEETRKGFAGLNEEQKAMYATSLAGKTGMSGLLAIVNASEADFKKVTAAINDSNGAAYEMYEIANDNLNGQLTILKSTIESIAISFGNKMVPYIKKANQWLQDMADKVAALTDEQQNMIIKVSLIAAAIGPAILIFGKMVTAVGVVVSAVGKVGAVFKTFGTVAGIISAPAGVVVGALLAIVAAVVLVWKNWDKIKPVVVKVANQMKVAIVDFANKAKIVLIAVVEQAKSMINQFKPTLQSLVVVFKNTASKVGAALGKLIEKIVPVFEKIKATIIETMPAVRDKINEAFVAIRPYIMQAIELIKQVVEIVGNVLTDMIEKATPVVEKLGACFEAVFPVISKHVSTSVETTIKFLKAMEPVFKVVCSVASNWIKFLGETVKSIFAGIMTTLGGIIDFITGVFSGNWQVAWEGVRDIFKGIVSTFATIMKYPLNAMIALINGAIKGFNQIKMPDWVPEVGGKGINIPLIPTLAKGTNNWGGGIVQISERGGEIVDLPSGSRVYPHDKSVKKAYQDGAQQSKNVSITVPKLADTIVIREEADIDRLIDKLATNLEKTAGNMGGGALGYLY